MPSFSDLEKKGVQALQTPSARDEDRVLDDLGLFGVHMAVVGLGVTVFASIASPKEVGKNLMIMGVALGAAGYGVRWLS